MVAKASIMVAMDAISIGDNTFCSAENWIVKTERIVIDLEK